MLSDGDLVKPTDLPIAAAGQKAWIQYEFAKPQTIRAVSPVTHGGENPLDAFIGPQDTGRALEVSLGVLWKPPYKVEVTDALKPGDNKISVKVTNLWVNRLIGDQQPKMAKKITFTIGAPYKANLPMLRSGLVGPVRILVSEAGGLLN